MTALTNYSRLVIEALNTTHDRSGFQCGIGALNTYIKRQARQDIKRRISRVFVATRPEAPSEIVGYYSLSSLSIELRQLPQPLARKLTRHRIPAALIDRLAVSQAAHGNGVGRMLLVDAIKRTLSVSDEIGIYAMVVDAISDEAQRFYEQFGFIRLGTDGARLLLPLQSI